MMYQAPRRISAEVCGVYIFSRESVRLYLPLVDVQAHTTILASTSRTKLTQTFVNSSSTKLRQVHYVFPLYEGVSVVAFTCRIGDRTIIGEVKERDMAKQVFNEAVASGQRAALLEQAREASDCFTTSVGNIPAGAKVEVEIVYVGELKHDAEVDGIRLTIPSKVVPRYGNYPVSLLPAATSTNLNDGKMQITVDVVLPRQSSIQKIQSPSHPISVNLGTTSVCAPNAEPSLSKASATLAINEVGMDKDFVLQVVAKDTGVPTAVLETHPTIPNHRAIMTTLVPRFSLPQEHPEIVFVVDRSGSMAGRPIELVKSALKVFLKSIAVGVKFNICSFGSTYSFLWKKSQSYNQGTLDEALRHVQTMSANLGGTEMFNPIKATIDNRFKDLNLEVLLLTDGEIWDQQSLFSYLDEQVTANKSPLRVFTLGVGSGVSHALIEGVARAGHGFAQAVSDGEKMDSKLIRMLKGAMSPHVTDYSLEVKYASNSAMDVDRQASSSNHNDDDDFELIERVEDCLKINTSTADDDKTETQTKAPQKPISLFDPTFDPEKDDYNAKKIKEGDKTGESRYAHLPAVQPPKLLQAPHVIPPLFAFNRTSVYLLLSPECSHLAPKSVVLRGKSKHGPLELEIPIQSLEGHGELVHQLAAKKAIAELEQGRGWLKSARDQASGTLLSDKYQSRYDEMVEREAVRLGVQFQVGGKWTSFVAVEKTPTVGPNTTDKDKREKNKMKQEKRDKSYHKDNAFCEKEDGGKKEDEEEADSDAESDSDDFPPAYAELSRDQDYAEQSAQGGSSVMINQLVNDTLSLMQSDTSQLHSRGESLESALISSGSSRTLRAKKSRGVPVLSAVGGAVGAVGTGIKSLMSGFTRSAPAPKQTYQASPSATPAAAPLAVYGQTFSAEGSQAPAAPGGAPGFDLPRSSARAPSGTTYDYFKAPTEAKAAQPQMQARTKQAMRLPPLEMLVELQTFEGYWMATSELAGLLGMTLDKIKQEASSTDSRLLATALAIAYFETKLQKDKDTWELLVEKAKGWLAVQLGGEEKVEELLTKAVALL